MKKGRDIADIYVVIASQCETLVNLLETCGHKQT